MKNETTEQLMQHAAEECDKLWAKCESEGLSEKEKTALALLSQWMKENK